MGYMTAGWGVGTIVGPTLGGLLARPCDVFASGLSICHDGSWFAERYRLHNEHTDNTAYTSRVSCHKCFRFVLMKAVWIRSTLCSKIGVTLGD